MWICDVCGGHDVEYRLFVKINDVAQSDLGDVEIDGENEKNCYCNDCEDNVTITEIEL